MREKGRRPQQKIVKWVSVVGERDRRRERYIEKERDRERWGPQQKRIKDVSLAAWREKREHEKERAIVYMFEK